MKMLSRIIEREGGFKSKSLNGTNDPITLFGVIDEVWARLSRKIPSDDPAKPAEINKARAEMQPLGHLCEPFEKPKKGVAFQAHARPKPDISLEELSIFNDTREKALQFLHKEYFIKPGLDQYPEFIQLHLLDFNVNKGSGAARWALTEALYKTKILPIDEVKKLPHLSAKQAADKDAFSFTNHNPNSIYASLKANDILLPCLKKLEADAASSDPHTQQGAYKKQEALIKAYGEARTSYYHARVHHEHAQQTHSAGWLNRVKEMNTYSLADLAVMKNTPTPEIPSTATHPPATKKIVTQHR